MKKALRDAVNNYADAVRQSASAGVPAPGFDPEEVDSDREGLRRSCDDLRETVDMADDLETVLPKIFFLQGSWLRLLAMAPDADAMRLVASRLWELSAELV